MNIVGLDIGKWLNNVGALAGWIPALLLMLLSAISWSRFGAATPLTRHTLAPSTSLKDVIFWSTIAFAFGGVESDQRWATKSGTRGERCRPRFPPPASSSRFSTSRRR